MVLKNIWKITILSLAKRTFCIQPKPSSSIDINPLQICDGDMET